MTAEYTELRRLLDEATPGPWMAEGSQVWGPDGVLVAAVREHSTIVRPDALIIAAAVNALPDLLGALEKAEAAVNRVRALHAPISKTVFDGISFVPHDTLTDCGWCDTTYPCPTIQALDGGGSDE